MTAATQTSPDDALKAASPSLSPGGVLEAMENPEVFAPVFRGMAIENAFRLRDMMRNSNVSVKDRLEYQNLCMKYGGVRAEADAGSMENLPSITIILPGAGRQTTMAPTTIDITPKNELEAFDDIDVADE